MCFEELGEVSENSYVIAAEGLLNRIRKSHIHLSFVSGATKEIGTALTRICLRHKAVEARMKTFTR